MAAALAVFTYATARLATTAYQRMHNPAATTTRTTAIGNVVLTAFRLPKAEWVRISKLVTASVEGHG